MTAPIVTIGIDVGAPKKGYHAVALRGTEFIGKFHSSDEVEIARWCVTRDATIVSVDAPCRWRVHGGDARLAERQLAAERISCFSTPTEAKARGHAFYTWMFAGQKLYAALAPNYPVYSGDERITRIAIETFPHAVACALAGAIVSAKSKFTVRGDLMRRSGIDPSGLSSVDEVDAALCALAASALGSGNYKSYGDSLGGFIIVPEKVAPTNEPVRAVNERVTAAIKPVATARHVYSAIQSVSRGRHFF